MSEARWPELAIADELELPAALAADPRAWLARVLEAVFACEKRELSLSVYFCGDEEIARLHGVHLGVAEATDVISFPLADEDVMRSGEADGELVIGVEFARRACEEYGNEWEAEVALYVVHGVLHLLGYDDHDEADLARMHEAEARALQRLEYRIASRYR